MNKNFVPPVSIEEFAAYLDGNLTEDRMNEVASLIHSDKFIQDIISDSIIIDNNIAKYESMGQIVPDIIESDDFEIPNITDNFDNSVIFSLIEDSINVEAIGSSHTDDSLAVSSNINNNLNTYTMANNSRTIIYGEAGENISDPVFIQQPDDHSCALRSQQIVLRDFGIDIPFKDLEQIALDYGVYSNEGTYTYDIGKVLQLAGVGMHQTVGNSVDDLINELVHGHRVIVSVDAYELWHNNTMGEKIRNWFMDAIGIQGGNHALIVAGIEIDLKHPENSKAVLTDPGAGHLRIEYPMDQFKRAWGDSNCFMAATNDSAPYQYDASTGMEVPSNFAVQQYINDFVMNNSYQLSPDMINVPQEYQPAFTGHLNVVGGVDYETFKSNYDTIVESRIPSPLSVKEQIEEFAKHAERQENPHDNVMASISKISSNGNDDVEQTNNWGMSNHGSSSPNDEENYNDEGSDNEGYRVNYDDESGNDDNEAHSDNSDNDDGEVDNSDNNNDDEFVE